MNRFKDNPWAILLVMCFGFFMILLDTTIVNTAIPSMIDGLKASLDEILWVLNAYILVYAVLLITAGRLGDIYGPRNLFAWGMALFTLASALCGMAQSPTQLILARVLQGIGAALLTPQSLSIITNIFPADRRGAAFGVWGAVAGVAAITGPTLGGFLVTDWGWRWIFFVNLPVGIFTLIASYAIVPDLRPARHHRLDIPGVLLATLGLFGVTFGLIEGERYDWGTVWSFITIPEIIGAGVLLCIAFLVLQRIEKEEPLVPFAIFADRNYTLMNLVSGIMAFGMFGLFLPLMIYFQSVLGMTAFTAGVTVAPMSAVSMFVAPVAGRLADRIGGKYILMAGLTAFAAGMGYIDWIAATDSTRWSFLPGLLVSGFGMGCIFAPLATMAMRNVDPRMAGAASGVLNTTRQLGGVIGSAAVGALLQNRLAVALHDQAVSRSSGLPAPFRDRFVSAFNNAAKGGLEVGRGQTGESPNLPPDLPHEVVAQIQRLAHVVFEHGFVDAMRPSLALPILLCLAGALSCLAIRRQRREGTLMVPEAPEAVPTSVE